MLHAKDTQAQHSCTDHFPWHGWLSIMILTNAHNHSNYKARYNGCCEVLKHALESLALLNKSSLQGQPRHIAARDSFCCVQCAMVTLLAWYAARPCQLVLVKPDCRCRLCGYWIPCSLPAPHIAKQGRAFMVTVQSCSAPSPPGDHHT